MLSRIMRQHSVDRKSTRLNSSHLVISYAVFCLKNKNYVPTHPPPIPHHAPRCTSRLLGGTDGALRFESVVEEVRQLVQSMRQVLLPYFLKNAHPPGICTVPHYGAFEI